MKYWPTVNQTPVLPPIVKKQPGRPKKRRIIKDSEMEKNKDPTNCVRKGVLKHVQSVGREATIEQHAKINLEKLQVVFMLTKGGLINFKMAAIVGA